MKVLKSLFFVVLLLFTTSFQFVNAQSSLSSQMNDFFCYNDNQAYKVISWFAHPMNKFSSGSCEVYGENIYITINSIKYCLNIKLHKNGSRFDHLEIIDDNDWWTAFKATNGWKNIALDFWRGYETSTLRYIENLCGSLNNLNCEQMCLAVLTALLWKYPSSQSSPPTTSQSQYTSHSNSDRDVFYEDILSRRRLTESDLYGKSKDDLSIMRNRIYAHYGYRFKRDDLFNYFRIYSWYNPYTSDSGSLYSLFSEIERYNIEFIKSHEQ